ncbi:hypothetical protein H9X96_10655 [Pedobacter sp. N36a]|uniref:hypothetical protein n=1 Tax=Pedobacter sp. N36a TaxID=2767996 RepID=UPI0016570D33|nr:hypothetical protein [Pedobacter sp. N36a]MBC8986234.1 hypothetical protein [Pedobacter sp. N36a]
MCRFLIYLDVEVERRKDKELFAWIREAIAIPTEIDPDLPAWFHLAEIQFKTLFYSNIHLTKTPALIKQFGGSSV